MCSRLSYLYKDMLTYWTLRNKTKKKQNLYFAKSKSVICTLPNRNLYEFKLCTLQNENRNFTKTFCEEASTNPSTLLQSWPSHIGFCRGLGRQVLYRQQPKAFLIWCLENADFEHSDSRPERLRPSGFLENSDTKKTTIIPASLLELTKPDPHCAPLVFVSVWFLYYS